MGEHHPHQRLRRGSIVRSLRHMQTAKGVRQTHLSHQLLDVESFVKRMEQQLPPLKGHRGCVNTIAWDESGEFLLTGSDDTRLNIYRPLDRSPLVHSIPSGHTQNIFSARFLTNSSASKIVSCSLDGFTRLTDVNQFKEKSKTDSWLPAPGFCCHTDMLYEVMPDIVDGHVFYDCAGDGKLNRYDLRMATSCNCIDDDDCNRNTFINVNAHRSQPNFTGMPTIDRLYYSIRLQRFQLGISAITQRPEMPVYIAAACSDDTVRIYDTRKVNSRDHRGPQVYSFSPFIPSGWVEGANGVLERGSNAERGTHDTKITSLKYDPCRTGQLLVSYSRGNCFLVDPSGLFSKSEDPRLNVTKPDQDHEKTGESRPSSIRAGKRRRRNSDDSPKLPTATGAKSGKNSKGDTSSSSDTTSERPAAAIDDDLPYWRQRSFEAGKSDILQVYSGHQNEKTMIKEANFFGPNSECILSGSDDGRIFFWNKKDGRILNVIKGDREVVNCIQPHPHSPFLLSASGIDSTTKIFLPTANERARMSDIKGVVKPTSRPYELKPGTIENGPGSDVERIDHVDEDYPDSDFDSDDDDDDDDDDDSDGDDDDNHEDDDEEDDEIHIDIAQSLRRRRRRRRRLGEMLISYAQFVDDSEEEEMSDSGNLHVTLNPNEVAEIIRLVRRPIRADHDIEDEPSNEENEEQGED